MNRVKQVATRVGGVGTNDLDTWGSVPAGYVAFADAVLPVLVRYTIYDFTTHDWEVGYGAYSGGTLERSYVIATSDDSATDIKFDFASESVIVSIDTDSTDQELLTVGRYGDASDGDITLTGTTIVLTQPLFAGTLTLSATGQIETRGYPIYAHVLDLRNAVEKAIYAAGDDGSNSTTSTGGAAGTAPSSGLWSAGRVGSAGRSGATGNGSVGTTPSGGDSYGGKSNGGAAGGDGDATTGGAAGGTASFAQQFMGRVTHTGRNALTVTGCGTGGTGGSSGGGKSPDVGAGGGGGGASGGVIAIYARLILLDGADPGAIWAPGGNGGNSTRAGVLGTGGGAGGGGGGGGFVYIVTDAFVGNATDVVNVDGGDGGDGSAGSASSHDGAGGAGGDGGVLTYFSAAQGVFTGVGTAGTAGAAPTLDGPGGAGGAGGAGAWSLP
jgi:hypothetical protein